MNHKVGKMFVTLTSLTSVKTQVEAYLTQGEGGRKISSPKQLAAALMEKSTIKHHCTADKA